MVRQRRPVQSLQEALSVPIRPAAGPVSLPSTVAPPPDLPIYDFAEISQTVAGFMAQQQKKRNQAKVQEGEQFVEENRLLVSHLEEQLAGIEDPKERDRVMREQFAFLQRSGTILPMGDPFKRIGYHRAAGRVMAGKYWQALQGRLDEVTLVKDAQGNPLLNSIEPEQVMAQEWAKIARSPAVRDFYGGQEALAEKQRADGQFLERVTARRSQAEEVEYTAVLAQEIGQKFDAVLDATPIVTSADLQPVTDYLTKEVQEHNVLNPRQVVMQALELSIRRKAAVDTDEALRTVLAAQDLVVGGVRLGDDRGDAGLRLEELTRQVRVQAKDTDRDELQREDSLRAKLIQGAQNDYLPALQKAKREGQSVMAVAAALEEEYAREDAEVGRFQGRAPFVIDAMREVAQALDGERRTDAKTLSDINVLIADGDADSADALVDSALRRGAVSGQDYADTKQAIRARRDVSQFVEGDEHYRSILSRYRQSAPSGYAGEIQDRLDSEQIESERRLSQDFSAYVRTTEGQPNREALHRDWLARREESDLKPRRAQAEQLRQRQAEVVRDVRGRQARFQDSSDLIAQGLEEGTLTILGAAELREEDIKAAANKDNLINTALVAASDQLKASLEAEFRGPPQDQDQVALQVEAYRLLRDGLTPAIDAVLADPAADPRTFSNRARAEGRRVVDELSDSLFPTERKAIKQGVESGEGATETLEKVDRARADRGLGDVLSATLADPTARSTIRHTDPIFAPSKDGSTASLRDPRLPTRFYDYLAAWWSGRDPIFGTPVKREDVEAQVIRARRDGAADGAVLAAMDLVGIDALDVVRGEMVIEAPQTDRTAAQEEISRLEAGIRAGIMLRPEEAREDIAALRARLEPIRIPLGDHKLRPYITPFFRSREAFYAFTDDPAYSGFLRRLGIAEEDRKDWEERQLDAMERSR